MKKSKTGYLIFLKRLKGTHFFKVMRVTVFLLLIGISSAFASSTYSQSTKFTFDLRNISLEQLFEEIQIQSEFNIFYKNSQVDNNRKVDITANKSSVEDILKEALEGTQLDFKVIDQQIVIFPEKNITEEVKIKESEIVQPQQKPISGKVTDSSGSPLPGVTVVVKGTTEGTVTNATGNYSLTNIPESATLVFSFVGMITQEVEVGTQTSINITLIADAISVEEVVAIGYSSHSKKTFTGSIAEVKSEDLVETPTPSLTQSMQGKVSGVFIKNVNGQPGDASGVDINIRGFGTPLFIIDGLPATEFEFNKLDPSDIEDFNILKDAAAAAVYGARAGNGVVLVKTKRGKTGKPIVTYGANFGAQFFTVTPDFVNSEQYAQMENVAYLNSGLDPIWTDEQIQLMRDGTDPEYPNIDWWSETMRNYAPQMQHNLNIRGGNEKVKYFISGSYYYQEDMLKANDTKVNRYSLRSNLDIAITDKLNAALDMSIIDDNFYAPVYQMERSRHPKRIGIMTYLYRVRPYFPLEYPDPTKLPGYSPVAYSEIDNVGYKKRNSALGDVSLSFSYDLPLNIQAKAVFNYARNYGRHKEKILKTKLYNYDFDTDLYTVSGTTAANSGLTESIQIENNFNQQYFLTWKESFADHNLDALVVYEQLSDNFDMFEASRIRYEVNIDYLFAGPELDKSNNGYASEGGRKSLISSLNYNYKGKYLFGFSSRYDGSPKFPPETRWGFFPSFSLGWNISDESFFIKNVPYINNLKLRASRGNLGYDATGSYQYLATFSLQSNYIFDGQTNVLENGIRANAMPNTSITWEKMTTTNGGLDFGVFDNKIVGSFDYFYRLRTDVLGSRDRSIPDIVGASLPKENYQKYDNRGWEASIVYKERFNELEISIGGNISWNREKLVYTDQNEFVNEEARKKGNVVGEWTDRTWGLISDGLFQTKEEINGWADQDGKGNATILPGDIKYIDYNEDGIISGDDYVLIGRGSFPRFTYGTTLDIRWKGVELNMLWQGAGLYDYNMLRSPDLTLPFYAGNTPQVDWYNNTYIPENPWMPSNTTNAVYPRYRTDRINQGHSNRKTSDFWLIDGSYIRLKTLQLAYTIPKAMTQKIGIDNLKVYVSGYNLLTFSAVDFIDPEADTNTTRTFGDYHPPLGSYNIGLQLQF